VIVVDASIALKWLLAESDSAKARALCVGELAAPSLLLSEVTNSLWRYVRLSRMTAGEAFNLFRQLQNLSLAYAQLETDVTNALSLAIEIDHPVYACSYLALAIREGTYVVTADNRFASSVRKHGRWMNNIKLLSET
jgi:predicted nucleic acid-binding protein